MTSADEEWDYEPLLPLSFCWGHLEGEDLEIIQGGILSYGDLESAIAALSFRLPAEPLTWASVLDAQEHPVMAFIHQESGELSWRGCKLAFDQLARWWTPEETMWAAACAQNRDVLRAVLDEEG